MDDAAERGAMTAIPQAYKQACKLAGDTSTMVSFEHGGVQYSVKPMRLGATVQLLRANEARLIAENAELRERVSAARNEIEGMIHEICLLKSMLPMGYNYVTYPPSKEALEIQKRVEGKNG